MKKVALTLLLGTSIFSFAQKANVTNKEGSEYRFEQLVHLDATPVESQGWTGTCWSFSALSFFETELDRMGKEMPTLSEMYIVYQAYLGKAEKYFRTDGNTNFDEGGAFHDIPWVIRKFGVVPKEAFTGLNYGSERHNHSEMVALLKGAMDGVMKARDHVDDRNPMTSSWKKALRGILNAYLGEVPEDVTEFKFKVEGKEYNPISYRDELGLNMDDYVSITSFSNHPYYEKCQLAIADNWVWGSSYNVPLADLWAAAEYALKEGYSFAWGADVSEKYFSFRSGLAIVPKDKETIYVEGKDNKNFSDAGADKKASCFLKPGEELEITQELRQAAYDGKETTDDHGMHAVGLFKDQNDTKYLLIKNSWGTTSNDCDGYFYASEAYFKYKTINIYLHKDAISKDMKKKLNIQ
ncbi:aminopeptidase [Paracrocinitomix mangrovi]|uniref:aminopeptidase C n=1 Tax=Paracrocinitomix mangrovi TaxID=2862509 RepID=UPI001C8D99E5|nr:C1 family peptidase [Paracrocinitomix mangrovi]UKN00147.1 aminopeptidase [Paracrocinitomix mangrovi]